MIDAEIVICVVMPEVTASIGFPDPSDVCTENELVTEVVLGF